VLAKSYRPVVLLKTIAKPLSITVAENISYILEKHRLLPNNHFSAQPGRSTTDALHLLTKYVHDAWRTGKVATALFLDVKGAFPSVRIETLTHEMRKRGIPNEYVLWIQEKLTGRTTNILFDDHRSEPLEMTRPRLFNVWHPIQHL
jgi:hypothetical protein